MSTGNRPGKKSPRRGGKGKAPVPQAPAAAGATPKDVTDAGPESGASAFEPNREASAEPDSHRPVTYEEILHRRVLADAFSEVNPHRRERLGLPPNNKTKTSIMVELNLLHSKGLEGAERRFHAVYKKLRGLVPGEAETPGEPVKITDTYYRADITIEHAERLILLDQLSESEFGSLTGLGEIDRAAASGRHAQAKERSIFRVWPDFNVSPDIDQSVATVKADAARRSFGASGSGITWAVIDSGIEATHQHFKTHDTLGGDVAELHRDFTMELPETPTDEQLRRSIESAKTDARGHGTHVAGIIAGALFDPIRLSWGAGAGGAAARPCACVAARSGLGVVKRAVSIQELERFTGVAPRCKLVSLKVLPDKRSPNGDSSSNVLRALQYIRRKINGEGKIQRIDGVNLSVGYEFDAKWFACGQSPICVEVDRLVRSGVVVVVSAGNTGYGSLTSQEGFTSTGLSLTINDPGNAALAITVGATHRDKPYMYGVSFFSSKGPTGDGRLKPDLVAPGERITSCAAGSFRKQMEHLLVKKDGERPAEGDQTGDDDSADCPDGDPDKVPCYIDQSGTSMAAPHVSGAAAALLSIRREFIGRPEEIKRILLATATSLGRERYFEGHGLVDLMRAIQSI